MFKRRAYRNKPTAYIISEAAAPQSDETSVHVRATSGRSKQAERVKTRVLMCAVVFTFVFASLGVRLAFISFGQIDPGRNYAAAAIDDTPRPELVDRRGALLATDLPMIALEIAGKEVWDVRETTDKLLTALPDLDVVTLEEKLKAGRYVEVRSDLSPKERQAVFDLGIPGVRFAARSRRIYPQADLAAHIIGHEEAGKGGVMGLEYAANHWRGGPTMTASIDIRVQQVLEEELASAREEFSAIAAWGAIMDVATGEVIALASLPDFDPNAPGAAPADFRRNRAVYDRYELGSAFKAFTAAAVIDAGVATEKTNYDARGVYKVADRTITDFHGENRVLTMSEVVQYSSNIGIARAVQDLGPKAQQDYLEKLGLFDPLEVELPGNRAPELPRQWGPVESVTVAFGHGISVTPLHLLAAFSAVVNGGEFHQPTFLATSEATTARPVFSRDTSASMRRILRRVVTDGTAGSADVAGYFPIGKTATADKPAAGGYDRNTRIASFVGAIPGYAPRYAILISLDEPQPTKDTWGYATAGWNAAPAFARIVERAAPLLGLSPVNEAAALAAFVSGDLDSYREARVDFDALEGAP